MSLWVEGFRVEGLRVFEFLWHGDIKKLGALRKKRFFYYPKSFDN